MKFLSFRNILLVIFLTVIFVTATESKKLLFYTKKSKKSINMGLILSTNKRLSACPPCHLRDHTGKCRRMRLFQASKLNNFVCEIFENYENPREFHTQLDKLPELRQNLESSVIEKCVN